MKGEPLKLVDGGESQRTFIYIKDAIEAVQRMIVRIQLALEFSSTTYIWCHFWHMLVIGSYRGSLLCFVFTGEPEEG
jgi:hypothetical protein